MRFHIPSKVVWEKPRVAFLYIIFFKLQSINETALTASKMFLLLYTTPHVSIIDFQSFFSP